MIGRTWSLFGTMVVAAVTPPRAAWPQEPRDDSAARQVLARAVDALGSQWATEQLAGILLRGTGTRTWIGQGSTVDEPAVLTLAMEWIVDFAGARVRRSSTMFQRNLPYFSIRSYYSPDRAFHVEAVTDVIIPVPPGAADRSRRAALARFPEPRARLVELLRNGSEVGPVERRREGERAVDVVSTRSAAGDRWRVFVDVQSGLVVRMERPDPAPMLFEALPQSIEFAEYREVAGIKMASWIRETTPTGGTIGAVTIDEYRYSDMLPMASFPDSLFAQPRRGFPRQPDDQVSLREIAPDVVFVENARPNYNQLAVAFDDFLLVVDAPFNRAVSDSVRARLARRFPGKPVRYIVPTHFHYDHVGGVPAYVEGGARVVTTTDNVRFFRDLVERAAAFSQRPAPELVIDEVHDSLVISDGRQTVVLYVITPTEHVNRLILVSVPSARALFVADVVSADWGRPRPAIPETFQFADDWRRLDLNADLILPSHGPPLSRAGLEWILEEGRLMQRSR